MNSREIQTLKQQIFNYASKGQLKDAFEALSQFVANAQNWKASDKLSELENNYKYLLHYTFEGIEDPKRTNVYNGIIRSIYELTEDISDELLQLESPNYFYERLRIDALKNETFTDIFKQLIELGSEISIVDLIESGQEKTDRQREIEVKRERSGILLFNHTFTSPRTSLNSKDEYLEFLNSFEISTREKCLFISALMLNVFHRFDPLKVEIIMSCTQSELLHIRARAYVALVLILYIYDYRWNLYPKLQNKLDALAEHPDLKKAILRVVIQLIRARDTERISKKVTEEIIPQMMKFSNMTGKKISMEDLMGESELMDKNPEWQKEIEESGLSKKLQEYSELQMEGADVFHSTFASLKSYPFFSEMSNWFLLFDKDYSQLLELFPDNYKNSILNLAVVESGHMCNSDKYSFSLSLLQIPESQREMMMGKMGAESEEVKRIQQEAQEMNPKIDEEVSSNQYIQDLYRFYKLSPKRNNFFDIFKLGLDFYQKTTLAPLIADIDSMNKIANYCFEKNFFEIALSIYNLIIKEGNDTGTTWQKAGYCNQMLDNKEEALKAYMHSDLISPDKTWTLRRIAQLFRSIGDPEKALQYYQKIARLNPDNLNNELNIGHCYLELKEYDKALNNYFKVEMLDSQSSKAFQPIAWTTFLAEKYDVSEKYYKRILDDKPTVHDFLNAGHLQLVLNNKKQAMQHYEEVARLTKNIEEFESMFTADEEILITKGIDQTVFSYIFDQIKYLLD